MGKMMDIPLDKIRANPAALRGVNHEAVEFHELVESIKTNGVLQSILVRPSPAEETAKDGKEFILIDGLQRFTASQEAQRPDIPAMVVERDDADALATQIIGNAHRIETKPVEYMRAIVRLLGFHPTMTVTELGNKLGKSPDWLNKILNLGKLNQSLNPLVNEGKIPLSNAFMLTKLPQEEQIAWAERAQTMTSAEFTPKVNERVKQIRDANRQGNQAGEEVFVPTMTLRKKGEIEAELKTPAVGPALISELGVAKSAKGKDDAALQGFILGLQWTMNFDAKSIEVQKAKDAERRLKAEEDKTRRDAEKKDKRAQEARENQAKLEKEAEEAKAKAAALPARETVPA